MSDIQVTSGGYYPHFDHYAVDVRTRLPDGRTVYSRRWIRAKNAEAAVEQITAELITLDLLGDQR